MTEALCVAEQASSADLALDVSGLTVSLRIGARPVTILSDVSIQVEAGHTLGLVGESGSGKSITCLALMGLLSDVRGRVESGSIRYFGRDISRFSQAQMRNIRGAEIGMVFQDASSSLDPAFTIGQQIVEILRTHRSIDGKAARAMAIDALAMVGIPEPSQRVDDYPHQFSGGMRQRAMIAMAICCEPRLLLADECTSALDVTTQAQILELLQNLSQRMGMATIFTTHDLGVVAQLCDTVAVMYAGQVVEYGTTDDIFYHPRQPYTESLLRCAGGSAGMFSPIAGHPPSPLEWPVGCRFEPRCPYQVSSVCAVDVIPMTALKGQHARCARQDVLTLQGVSSD